MFPRVGFKFEKHAFVTKRIENLKMMEINLNYLKAYAGLDDQVVINQANFQHIPLIRIFVSMFIFESQKDKRGIVLNSLDDFQKY